MKKWLRLLSGLLFVSALLALLWLLLADAWNGFRPTVHHQQIGALALALIGSAFIFIQFSTGSSAKEKLKGVLLGLAFVLWGGEVFLPVGRTVTAIDSVVIAIFVVDLGLLIAGHLERSRPKN